MSRDIAPAPSSSAISSGEAATAATPAATPAGVDEAGPTPPLAGDRDQQFRLVEALLFAAAAPVEEVALAARLQELAGLDAAATRALLLEVQAHYASRGVQVQATGGRWTLRTAADLGPLLAREMEVPARLSRAALETLAIIAYHQPVTRAEIESIRGVATSKGTLDILMESGWIKPGRRRETPGRPLTWLTTADFLDHFGLESLRDLPGVDDLRAAGLLDARPAVTALLRDPGEGTGDGPGDGKAGDGEE